MKYYILPVLLLVIGLTVSSCGEGETANPTTAPTESRVVEDQASLVAALQAAGAILEVGDSICRLSSV
jgi:hypothetical protein